MSHLRIPHYLKLSFIIILLHVVVIFSDRKDPVNQKSLTTSLEQYEIESFIGQKITNQIISDVTSLMTNEEELNWKHQASSGYMQAYGDDLFRCLCSKKLDFPPKDFDCWDYYGNISLSIIFSMDKIAIAKQIQISSKGKANCASTMSYYNNLDHELIFVLKKPVGFEFQCPKKSYMVNLLTHFKYKASSEVNLNATWNLGVEYDMDLLECWNNKENIDVIKLVDFTVLRLEFSIFEYILLFGDGEFKENGIEKYLFNHREKIRSVNPHCKIYIRVLAIDARSYEEDSLFRFWSVMAEFVSFWVKRNKGNEIFILENYPPSFKFDLNTKHIITELDTNTEIYKSKQMRCTNKFVTLTALSAFNSILLRNLNSAFVVHKSLLSDCVRDSSDDIKAFHQPNLSMIIQHSDTSDRAFYTILRTVTHSIALNIKEIYFHISANASVEHWQNHFYFLKTKNIEMCCFLKISPATALDSGNAILAEIKQQAGSFCGTMDKILIEIDIKRELDKIIFNVDQARRLLKNVHPTKILIPKINIDYIIQERRKKSLLPFSKRDVYSVYCDSLERGNKYFFKYIETISFIFGWDRLHLGHVGVDNENEHVWWQNIAHGNLHIKSKATDFPVLIRTNDEVTFESEIRLPMTYKCVQFTKNSLENNIPFLAHQHSGCTVYMNMKLEANISAMELKTMLLYAFGKFPMVELVVQNESELNILKDVLLDQSFLNIFRIPNKTTIYLELPLKFVPTSKFLDQISSDVSVHFQGWNDFKSLKHNEASALIRKIHDNRVNFGLSVVDCDSEIYTNFTNLKSFSLISQASYIVCNTKPVIPSNSNQTWMAEYLNTLFYIQNYISSVLPKYVSMTHNLKVYFRLNFLPNSICGQPNRLLGFLNDVSQHSSNFNMTYFLVKGFESQNSKADCSQSWWRLNSYEDLSNSSVYVDMEEEYFGRPTKQILKLPTSSKYPVRIEEKQNFAVVIVVSVISIMLLVVVITLWLNWLRMRSRYLSEKEINDFYNGYNEYTDTSHCTWLGVDFPKSNEIPLSNIKINGLVGSGEFGKVFIGLLLKERLEVAIKEPRSSSSKEIFKDALMEVKILAFLSKEQHMNIVQFVGACTREIRRGKLYIVMEYCKNGSLQEYLRKIRSQMDDTRCAVIDYYQLYKFAHEIATGMEYISNQAVVHGDLSTRNVLLDVNFTCKIGDFGLSRNLYKYTEYIKKSQGPLPWCWMALESLKNMEFTTKSDVWSYGVTLWEIFSLGMVPYPGISWSTDFVIDLDNGMRMGKAQFASEELHELMLNCWFADKNDRPHFYEMAEYFLDLGRQQYTAV